MGDAAKGECSFIMLCTGGLLVEGYSLGGSGDVRCSVNGRQTNAFTELASSPEGYDCASPTELAALAAKCAP